MDEQNLVGENNVKTEQKNNSSMRNFILLGAAVLVAGAVFGLGVYKVYSKASTDRFSLAVAKVFGLPAVKIGDKKIPYSAYAEDLQAIHTMRAYDKSQRDSGVGPERSPGADLTEDQMNDQVLWRLVNNLLVNEAAQKYGVTVEDKDVQNLKAQMLQQFKDEAAANQELTKRYGWDMSIYEQKVMRPFILQTKLAQKMKEDPQVKKDLQTQAEKTLEEVKNGADFAALARKYNADSTAQTGGDLGWFSKGEMVPEFEKAAFSLKKGEVYPTLVQTTYGYHIIKLDDKRVEKIKNAKGQMVDTAQVRASQILFKFPDLLSFLDSSIKNGNIKLYLKVHNPFAELNAQAGKTSSGSQQ
ncbi:MAG TPA: peptidylprolyl isomerase [Candidatus Udaeobacter sp.]|nr:peptidylprolyl isomerase [Candidatus Udaeobacter sp.]